MDNYLGDFKDVADEIKVDEPKEIIIPDCPTDMEEFWWSILHAREALKDALRHLADSAFSDRPGEIRVNTEHFMNIKGSVERALQELKDVEDNKRV